MEEITKTEANNPLEFKNRIDLSELQTSVAQIKSELGKVIIGAAGYDTTIDYPG